MAAFGNPGAFLPFIADLVTRGVIVFVFQKFMYLVKTLFQLEDFSFSGAFLLFME